MHLDSVTIRNLELVRPAGRAEQSSNQSTYTLLGVLDRTVTAMGSRLLREWLLRPLVNSAAIEARLTAVDELKRQIDARVRLRTALRTVQDISRLCSRMSLGVANPRDVLALKISVSSLPAIQAELSVLDSPLIADLMSSWDNAQDLYELIEGAIEQEAPVSIRDGGILKSGYHPEVDELRKASREGKAGLPASKPKNANGPASSRLKSDITKSSGTILNSRRRISGRYRPTISASKPWSMPNAS